MRQRRRVLTRRIFVAPVSSPAKALGAGDSAATADAATWRSELAATDSARTTCWALLTPQFSEEARQAKGAISSEAELRVSCCRVGASDRPKVYREKAAIIQG